MLRTVTLKEYLRNFRDYLHNPNDWHGSQRSLLAPRDTHVLMSAQSCILPVPREGEARFNVAIFNYQSRPRSPAVLAIVASSQGTSAQIIDNEKGYGGQRLFFNKNGEKCSFVGQRLTDYRKSYLSSHHLDSFFCSGKETKSMQTGAMSNEEKQKNMILIIQVPLKQPRNRYDYGYPQMEGYNVELMCKSMEQPKKMRKKKRNCARGGVNMEDAIIKVGNSEGKYKEIGGLEIKRDERFPVRVTLQYYKATDNGLVNDAVMEGIYNQLKQASEKICRECRITSRGK